MAEAKREFTKYERARIIGARGLQVSMDAPLLLKISDEELNGVNYDPLRIAEKELDSGVLPITINQPMPEKKKDTLEKVKIEDKSVSDEEKARVEAEVEKDIQESGEIMGMATGSEEEAIEKQESVAATNPELE
ncbi:DNA-directed RNA polymerase subunit K [archaeon]|jgi:DNA-directed RNA polymerase subunit K/omega|nr:DNA-directed RNA polymerase subunit K [archaeon]